MTDPAGRLPEPPRIAGRRNPRWIALGVVALCLGGLLSYMIYAQVAAQSAVVAMAATVDRGAVIQATDLTTTTVSGTTKVSTVPGRPAVEPGRQAGRVRPGRGFPGAGGRDRGGGRCPPPDGQWSV